MILQEPGYSSEYIVGSYGINRTDIHFGLGWGQLNNPKIASKILLYIYMMDLEQELITNFKGASFILAVTSRVTEYLLYLAYHML